MTAPPDAIRFAFAPDPDRARRLDRRMHRELGASLAHVRDRAAEAMPEAMAEPMPAGPAALDPLIARLEGGAPVAPALFGAYYELVVALLEGDAEAAAARFAELAAAGPAPQGPLGPQVVALDDPALGADAARFTRMMRGDGSIGFSAPAPGLAAPFAKRLAEGFALLDAALPDLAGEIRGIVRQIIICGGDPECEMQFDGGSHYQLWGGLFLNAAFHPDRVAVAEVLAHESAHSLLFGFTVDEPLVFNPDEELFPSPLRRDERPMDGIYHATFVSARMHWAMTALADSGALTEAERARALEAAEADRRNFAAGLGVVRAHGDLSATGAALMAAAEAHIAAAG